MPSRPAAGGADVDSRGELMHRQSQHVERRSGRHCEDSRVQDLQQVANEMWEDFHPDDAQEQPGEQLEVDERSGLEHLQRWLEAELIQEDG